MTPTNIDIVVFPYKSTLQISHHGKHFVSVGLATKLTYCVLYSLCKLIILKQITVLLKRKQRKKQHHPQQLSSNVL